MRLSLLLVENPQRELWLQKALTPVLGDPRRVATATVALMQADPSRTKAYVRWLASLALNGTISVTNAIAASPNTQIRLPEDAPRVQDTLTSYERAKVRLTPEQRDLTRFRDFYSVERIVDALVNQGAVKASALKVRQVPGAEIVYNQAPYTMYKVEKISKLKDGKQRTPEELERIAAIGALGMGPPETKWCTRSRYSTTGQYATHYLSSFDMYVIYKDGMPFIQKGGKHCLNANDQPINLPAELVAYFETEKARQLEINKKRMAAYIDSGVPGVALASGMFIKCDRAVNAGNYYYVVRDPVTNPTPDTTVHSNAARRAFLEKNGLAKFFVVQKNEGEYDEWEDDDEEDGEPRRRYTSTNHLTAWLYDMVLTVNTNNIVGFSGGVDKVPAPQPAAAKQPFAQRLLGAN